MFAGQGLPAVLGASKGGGSQELPGAPRAPKGTQEPPGVSSGSRGSQGGRGLGTGQDYLVVWR